MLGEGRLIEAQLIVLTPECVLRALNQTEFISDKILPNWWMAVTIFSYFVVIAPIVLIANHDREAIVVVTC